MISRNPTKQDAWNRIVALRKEILQGKRFNGQQQVVDALERVLKLALWDK